MPNRTEVTWQKPSRISTGRLPLLRLFSTLLAITLIERSGKNVVDLFDGASAAVMSARGPALAHRTREGEGPDFVSGESEGHPPIPHAMVDLVVGAA
jgi:hypothetical protein